MLPTPPVIWRIRCTSAKTGSMTKIRYPFFLLAAMIIFIIVLALPMLFYPLGPDQGEFAVTGREILAGKIPYVEIWNPKPPAIFYVFGAAMTLFGETTYALRILDLLLFPIIGAGLYSIGNRLANGRVGLMAVAIFALLYFRQSFWTLTQNDGIAIVPMLLAVLFAMRAAQEATAPAPTRTHATIAAALSGMFCALALWFKYPFIFFVIALVIGHVLTLWRTGGEWRQHVWRQGIAFALGGLLVGGGGMAYLAAIGAFQAWIDSALLTANYTRDGFDDLFTSVVWGGSIPNWLTWYNIIFLLGWLLVARVVRRTAHGWHTVWLWGLGGLAALISQAKGYDYHYLPMLPPLALIAADVLDRLTLLMKPHVQQFAQRALLPLVLATTAALLFAHLWLPALPYLSGRETQMDYYSRFGDHHFAARDSLAVAEYLRARNIPRDSLYVWGFRPEIYYLTQLRPATRFIFQFPLVAPWYPPEWRADNVATLWAALPPYALVVQADYIPWVTGRDEDSKTLMEQDYTDLLSWLQFNYEEEAHIGMFYIWRRRDL
jgi:hypothetical protein